MTRKASSVLGPWSGSSCGRGAWPPGALREVVSCFQRRGASTGRAVRRVRLDPAPPRYLPAGQPRAQTGARIPSWQRLGWRRPRSDGPKSRRTRARRRLRRPPERRAAPRPDGWVPALPPDGWLAALPLPALPLPALPPKGLPAHVTPRPGGAGSAPESLRARAAAAGAYPEPSRRLPARAARAKRPTATARGLRAAIAMAAAVTTMAYRGSAHRSPN